MQLIEQRIGNALVLSASGRIDHATAESFRKALQPYLEQSKNGDAIVLDMSEIEYISSVGFQVLLAAQRKSKSQQVSLAVASLRPAVKGIFEMANFAKAIRCFDNVRGALAEIAPKAVDSYTQGASPSVP
jgi:anti-anti-sigma factor